MLTSLDLYVTHYILIFDAFFYRFPSTFFFSSPTHRTRTHTKRTQNAPQVFGREEDTFTAVPSHLYYMMREVLKNSCRATVEHGRRTRPGEKLPPVKVRASKRERTNIPSLGCRNPLARFLLAERDGTGRGDIFRVWCTVFAVAAGGARGRSCVAQRFFFSGWEGGAEIVRR